MAIEGELLKRICADPSNLEPRLVYADRLLERGDPRGLFIAQQCELDRMDVLDERYAPMLASTRRLEAAHAHEWLREYVERTKDTASGVGPVIVDRLRNAVFRNGFMWRIGMQPEDIGKHLQWLTEREPIEGIELLVGEGVPRDLEGVESLGFRVLKVSPSDWFTANSVGNVLAWGMPALREIDLSRCDLGVTGCQLLANIETHLAKTFTGWRAPAPFSRGQIERLGLQTCSITDAGARLLFAAETLDGLRALDIGQCRLREKETLQALRDSPRMNRLVSISLAGNNDLKGHLGALAGWEALPQLERIALPQAISADELKALFPKPSSRLRELDLSSAKELLKDPTSVLESAEALTHLDVGGTTLGDRGWAELLAAPCMARVSELHANGCSLTDEAISVLTASKLERLVTLDVSSNKLTDTGVHDLAAWAGLEHITHLRIGNNRKLTAAAYAKLIDASHFVPVSIDIGKSRDTGLISRLKDRFGAALVVA